MVGCLIVLAAITGCTAAASGPIVGSTGLTQASATASPAPESSPAGTEPTPAPGTEPSVAVTQQVVKLAPGVADEASGIAASTGTPGAYYLVDDSTHTRQIVAVGSDGVAIADIAVKEMSTGNAEALGGGPCGSTPLRYGAPAASNCLFIGDIGDNNSRRDDIAIFRIGEPDLSNPPTEPVLADNWRYTYPDGPQDAESLMVAPDGSVIVVTKPGGGQATRMYRANPGGGELVFLREFTPPDPESRRKTLFTGNVVTDMTAAPGRVLLLTYDELTEYTAPDPAADISNFPDWPHHRLPAPDLPQAEGIASMVDGCGYVLASEAGPGGSSGSLGVVSCG